MKNILLIGGGGYVGTVMSSYFLDKGHHVTVLDNLIYDNSFAISSFLKNDNYKFINGDFRKIEDLEKASHVTSHVIILGGLVGDPITKNYPEESYSINNEGIKTCIDFFDTKKIEHLIFISTCSNYGLIKEDELADENFELNPLSLYAKAKVSAEKYLLDKKGKVNHSVTILRFATAFGLSPRMRFDLTISEFVRDIFYQEELLVFDENTWRPYCHINDFARLVDIVFNAPVSLIDFEVFNAGGEINNYTKKMVIDEILKLIPSGKVKYTSNGSDPRNYRVSFNKVKSILGFEPKYSVTDGIIELISSLKAGNYSDSIQAKEKYGNYTLKNDFKNS